MEGFLAKGGGFVTVLGSKDRGFIGCFGARRGLYGERAKEWNFWCVGVFGGENVYFRGLIDRAGKKLFLKL